MGNDLSPPLKHCGDGAKKSFLHMDMTWKDCFSPGVYLCCQSGHRFVVSSERGIREYRETSRISV